MEDSALAEWLVNSVLSVLVIALLGYLAVSWIPNHRPSERSALLVGVFVVLLVLPGLRALIDPHHWNRMDMVPVAESFPLTRKEVSSAQNSESPSISISKPVVTVGEKSVPEPWLTLKPSLALLGVWSIGVGVGVGVGLLRLAHGFWQLRRMHQVL